MPPRKSTPAPRPEVLAFLRAARETPDDDAPRLVLADWLEEHGDEHDSARAALVRLQCERARLDADDPRGADLLREEAKLWNKHTNAWFGPMRDFCFGRRHHTHADRRGLLYLCVEGRKILTRAGMDLAGTEPYAWVEGLRFSTLSRDGCTKLAGSDLLDGLASLSLSRTNVKGAPFVELISSPRLGGLLQLDLYQVNAPFRQSRSRRTSAGCARSN